MEAADGRALGTLTLEVGPAEAYPSEDGEALLREGAALLAGAMPPGVVVPSTPARWEGRPREIHPPEVTIRSVLVSDGQVLDERHFSFSVSGGELGPGETPLPLSKQVASYERKLIESALRTAGGNRARAARILQTTERILGYRIQQYDIDCAHFRRSSQ